MANDPGIPAELAPFHEKLLDGLEFCRLAYLLFETVRKEPDGVKALRMRTGPLKQLLGELFPICHYIQTFYSPGQYLSVCWVHGSQSFDAKVHSTGFLVDHGMWPAQGTLEVTQAVHGNEHLMREMLASTDRGGFGLNGLTKGEGKNGFRTIHSEPTSYTNRSYIGEMSTLIVDAIKAKLSKLEKGVYPGDTTLIVDCVLMTVFLPEEWDELVKIVQRDISPNTFVRIFLTANSGLYSADIKCRRSH